MLLVRSVGRATRTSSKYVTRLNECCGRRAKSTTSAIRSGLRAETGRGGPSSRLDGRVSSFRRDANPSHGSSKYGSRPSRSHSDEGFRSSAGGRSRSVKSSGRSPRAGSSHGSTYGAAKGSAGRFFESGSRQRPDAPRSGRSPQPDSSLGSTYSAEKRTASRFPESRSRPARVAPRSIRPERASSFKQHSDNTYDMRETQSFRSHASSTSRADSSGSEWIEPPSRRERRAAFWEQKQAEEAELEEGDDFDKPPSSYDAPRPSRGGRQNRYDSRPVRSEDRRQQSGARSEDKSDRRPIQRQERSNDVPAAIKYTTAASQFLYGANVVTAALSAQRRRIYHLYMHKRAEAENIGEIRRAATDLDVPITRTADDDLLSRMSDGRPHNGVVLETSPLVTVPVFALSHQIKSKSKIRVTPAPQTAEEQAVNGTESTIDCQPGRPPIVVFLNGITDPGNVGSIIRSAHFFGVDAVAIATQTCASLDSPVMAKASSGACEAIPILRVDKAGEFVRRSSDEGWTVIAAVAPQDETSTGPDFVPTRSASQRKASQKYVTSSQLMQEDVLPKRPRLLMLGSEGEGLPRYLQSRANVLLTIEGAEGSATRSDVGVDSMNVGVAAGVLMHALVAGKSSRQKAKQESAGEAAPVRSDTTQSEAESDTGSADIAVEQQERTETAARSTPGAEVDPSDVTEAEQRESVEPTEQVSASA